MIESEQTELTCCGEVFETVHGLNTHKELVHGPNTKQCERCGCEFEVSPANEDDRRQCTSCFKEYGRLNDTREKISDSNSEANHWNWKGGISGRSRSAYWRRQRDKIVERDNHECQFCGLSFWESIGLLDVHHMIPQRKFDNEKDAHDKSNLITLCRICHRRFE